MSRGRWCEAASRGRGWGRGVEGDETIVAKWVVVDVSARKLRSIRSQSLSGNRGQFGLRRALWFRMVVYWTGDAASANSGQRAGVHRVAVCRDVATVNLSRCRSAVGRAASSRCRAQCNRMQVVCQARASNGHSTSNYGAAAATTMENRPGVLVRVRRAFLLQCGDLMSWKSIFRSSLLGPPALFPTSQLAIDTTQLLLFPLL